MAGSGSNKAGLIDQLSVPAAAVQDSSVPPVTEPVNAAPDIKSEPLRTPVKSSVPIGD